jgi:hypothetical protein
MTRVFRSLVAGLAILATLLTAGAVGAARGQAAAAGEIVICSGGAAVTVPVDADGNPTGPPHWCPDCVLMLFAAAGAAGETAARPCTASPVGRLVPDAPRGAAAAPVAVARGPPPSA